jgi:hypothetical protein
MLKISILVVILAFGQALVDIPERARSGLAYRNIMKQRPLRESTPLKWPAKVDNFDSSSNATFDQRYYIDTQYWDKNTGPVFYEIGGEGTLSGPPGGYIGTLAREYKALIVALEHRFYGESIPNGNVLTENYKYLTVEQALADLAGFTSYLKTAMPETNNAKWFVFGGSYPGALSSWYRSSYPELSVGSLSSSGVVNCIIDYYGFDVSV